MPIQEGDIRLVESDTMSDADEGGGAITSNVIVDGESNNIFEDISTLDRVYGAVKMRKIFSEVHIQTQDKYFGSHIIISRLPKDEKIGVNLFNTEDWFDRRPEAQTRVENYRAKGGNYNGWLWATQWKDGKVLTIFQAESAPLPGVGDVLYLTNKAGNEFQYVKITKFAESLQTFIDSVHNVEYVRRILNIEISQSLDYDFVGSEISRYDNLDPDATIKNTVVANASKYYSARYMSVAGNSGDLSVNVDTVYSQVIPSSLQELAITDADASGVSLPVLNASNGTVSFQFASNFAVNVSVYLGSPCSPGTLSIPVTGGTIIDAGGQLKIGTTVIGTIDYGQGILLFGSTSPTYTGTKTITFNPAGEPSGVANTAIQTVTGTNRGYVWTFTISPSPKPKSVRISFIALGEWYDLYDDGTGGIKGAEDGIGTGTINYVTGTTSITLAALPDADSAILYFWNNDATYYNRSAIAPKKPEYVWTLTEQGLTATTLTIAWNDGVARTATSDSAGVITGDGVGTVDKARGIVKFSPNALPLGGTSFTIDYDHGTPLEQTFNGLALTGANLILNLGDSNIIADTVRVSWTLLYPESRNMFGTIKYYPQPAAPNAYAYDDGAGALQGIAGSIVDYVAGTITFNPKISADYTASVWSSVPMATYSPIGIVGQLP